jgi:site-specific DNA recombinase
MIPFVAYCRVSGMSQVEGDGFARQEANIGMWLIHQPQQHSLECVYREEGVSGKTDAEERPAFQRMVADLLSNGCRTIVIESMDRLARSYAMQEQLIGYLASKSLTLISANTGEDITAAMMGDPMKRALVQMQGIFAELEKNLLVAKLRKARQRIKSEGRKPGAVKYSTDQKENRRAEGRKPYGSLPGEAETLKTIRELAKMGTLTMLAEQLNQMEIPTRHGRKWHPATISKILRRSA